MKSSIKIIYSVVLLVITSVIVFIFNSPNNSFIAQNKVTNQWALNNTGQTIEGIAGKKGVDVNALKAWDITLGSNEVLVGILDTGIDISNQYISDSIYINSNEIPNNGLDDDNNGYIDDNTGWNFYDNNNKIFDNTLYDYHGTFITSLIAGSHDENNKVWGIAPEVKIVPLKFMRGSSGSMESAIDAIEYAYNLGVRIINCSWDTTIYNKELYDTFEKYNDILFITSSGKGKNNLLIDPVYPCSFNLPNVVCVSSVTNNGELDMFAGYGVENLVFAPGKDIIGLLPEGDYLYSDGTSFATAYVAGIAALVKSKNMDINSDDLANLLRNSNKPNNSNNSPGIIDANLALITVME